MALAARRAALTAAAEVMFAEDFRRPASAIRSSRGGAVFRDRAGAAADGKSDRKFDALIAATALATGASIAIRDTGGFRACGLTVIDPWTPG